MVVPFKDWRDLAEKVKPIATLTRPDWQTQDERILADKEFMKIEIRTAEEVMGKRCGARFRVRKSL